jgi:hypothetical protein
VSVIKDNQLTTCFDYVKTIDVVNTKKLISVLSVPSSYGAEDVACFTTQYGMVVLDRSGVIIGYINLSLSCNKLISNPVIREREHFSHNGLRLVGFSTSGRTKLLALLGITEAKK